MTHAALLVGGFLATVTVLLFVGGMVSAAKEIRAEKAAGLPVLRPGWRKADRPESMRTRYALPRGTGLVVWPLVAFGRADIAERYLVSRGGRVDAR